MNSNSKHEALKKLKEIASEWGIYLKEGLCYVEIYEDDIELDESGLIVINNWSIENEDNKEN